MGDILKQDIFFFVTTVAVVLVTLCLAILLVYVIQIARKVNHITEKIRTETDIITEELGELRRNIRSHGVKLRHFAKFFGAFTGSRSRKK